MRFVISKAHGNNQPFLLKNKNVQKRFLRLNTKEFVVSQAKFLVMHSYSVRVISKYPLSPKK
ncbi:hypothetical protein HMPREF1418_01225 [Helicobacter pylori GAM260BSi]|uniref:Uncharacterized protein n=1 Tax=Helicobacter pylori GAM260BSi TaxID=1159046 RepID=M3N282_HELPX|nr:hypothetical protein [Helicobacter pylori]EMH22134.1 hypothetical protein HMPREF1418_01225 [Helicobacter pylori GAM260BSi]